MYSPARPMDQLEQLAKPRCSRRVPGGGIDHVHVHVDVDLIDFKAI